MISPWHGAAIAAYGSFPLRRCRQKATAQPDQLDSLVPPTDYNRGVDRPDVLAQFQVCRSRRALPRTTRMQKL
jgi:hypothetical protein